MVGQREKTLALVIEEAEAGQAAKTAMRRGQHETAAIDQPTEARARTVARLEIGNRPRIDLDGDRLGDGVLGLRRPFSGCAGLQAARLGRGLRLREQLQRVENPAAAWPRKPRRD